VVFGSAIGSRMSEVGGVPYGAFIVPGLMMLALFTESISNASFGIYFPEVHRDHLRAAVGPHLVFEMIIGYVSIDMLPPGWRTFVLFNPVVYLISGFRWSFYGLADVAAGVSLGVTLSFLVALLPVLRWMVKTGYRLKQ
jgi:ABC-2 type transport system permease protein